jgi:transposase
MSKCTAGNTGVERGVLDSVKIDREDRQMDRYAGFVGLDVHKETIAVAVADAGRAAPTYWGEIKNTPKAISKLVQKLCADGELFLFCYEAGPCGYGIFRQLVEMGVDCVVVAPPKHERIKTDRRDALRLARLLRAGELRQVWVPGTEQEAMRDLSRCRGDFKVQEKKARQQLNAFVLRHRHHWPRDKSRWTLAHYRWLESLTFEHDWQREVRDEYLAAVRAATDRVKDLDQALDRALPSWSLAPVVASLVALRGVDKLVAITILAELGDISRFDSPKQLMAYLGLVPSEHSSGARRRQGAITLAGNGHARRMLIESAWSYRFPARQTAHLKRKAQQASRPAKTIAWRAQKRLCGRYRTLTQSGKNQNVVCVAVARELVGFIWDIVCQEMSEVELA